MEFRISKYNPQNRNNDGAYLKDEWTSVSDIGKKFNGVALEKQEYLRVENNYINFVCDVLSTLKISSVKLEKQEPKNKYKATNIEVFGEQFRQILQDNLRENFWCEFHSKNLKIWVGYDFYLHIFSKENIGEILRKSALKHELFVEED